MCVWNNGHHSIFCHYYNIALSIVNTIDFIIPLKSACVLWDIMLSAYVYVLLIYHTLDAGIVASIMREIIFKRNMFFPAECNLTFDRTTCGDGKVDDS